MLHYKMLGLPALIMISIAGFGQVDSVSVNRNNLLTGKLTEGKSSYCIFSKDVNTGLVSQISIWNREVSFAIMNGHKVVVVKQMRYSPDQKKNKYVYTVSDRATMQTIYNKSARDGMKIEAYNYNDREISGADSVKENTKRDFTLHVKEPPYCFEIDLETLRLLPILKVGQKLAVNFYHPGGETLPKYYPVDVIGLEELELMGGQKVICWKILLRYDENSFDYSWISKTSREFVKLEGHYGTTIFNKVKVGMPVL
ncbi:MAG: hypothetical protein ABJA70_23505 [Chryseolinea sp.]